MGFRRFLVGAAAVLPLLVSAGARADIKIAYVDLQRALMEIDEGRAAKAKLQGLYDSKQKEIDKDQEELRKEKDLLDKQASAMSEETRVQKQNELQKKLLDLAQRWEKGKQDLQTKERTELQAIFNKMNPIIADIAQREGFNMVFDKTDSGLVYAPGSLDLTNELVRIYNDSHKGGGKGVASNGPAKTDAPKKDAPKSDVPKK